MYEEFLPRVINTNGLKPKCPKTFRRKNSSYASAVNVSSEVFPEISHTTMQFLAVFLSSTTYISVFVI